MMLPAEHTDIRSPHHDRHKELLALAAELSRHGLAVRHGEPMSEHTTYRIGGPADLYAVAETEAQLISAIHLSRSRGIAPFLLGGGANLLVADAGIRGLVIEYRGRHHTFQAQLDDVLLIVEAGAPIKDLARECVARGLEGLEWAVDVPGTVGGAVVGNAGAYGGYVCDTLRRVKVLEVDGTVQWLDAAAVEFCYRGSKFKKQSRSEGTIVLQATFALESGDANEIAARAAQYTLRRRERQPQESSCGSVFKRTDHYPAGFLIEQCGLKGVQRGQAIISPKHANFVINMGGARAADVRYLIDLMRTRVKQQFDEALELEVELVGEWENGPV